MDLNFPLNGMGGLAPGWHGHPEFSVPHAELNAFGDDTMYADGIVNPFRRPGFLSPATSASGTELAPTSSAFGGVGRAMVVDESATKIYLLEASNGTKGALDIYVLDSFTDNEPDVRWQIAGASVTGTDMVEYTLNGVRSLYYSYVTGSTGNIGISVNYNPQNVTYFSTSATGGFTLGDNQHRLVIADNGFMYILDGNEVHKLDGSTVGGPNGIATGRILSFPNSFKLMDGVDGRGFIWLGLQNKTSSIFGIPGTTKNVLCGVYAWNRIQGKANMADFIPAPEAQEMRKMFFLDGVPWCITVGTNLLTQVRKYDGKEFAIEHELPKGSQPRFPQSAETYDGKLTWLGQEDGKMYVLGRVRPKAPLGIHIIGDLSHKRDAGQTWSNGGAIKFAGTNPTVTSGDYLYPDTILFNFVDSGTDNNHLYRWFPNTRSMSGLTLLPNIGNFKTIVKPLPKLSRVTGISMFFPALTTGSSDVLDLQMYYNRSPNVATTATLTQTDGQVGWYYTPLARENVNFVQLGIAFKDNVAVASHIFPEYAVVHYEKTGKKK